MKKRILTMILAGAMALSLAGCAENTDGGTGTTTAAANGGTTTAAAGGETTTAAGGGDTAGDALEGNLVLWGDQDSQAMLKEMADDFTAQNPGVTVEVRVQGEDTAKDNALNDLDAAADVFGIAHDQLGALVEAGGALPSTFYADVINANNSEASITAATYNDTLYGYPTSAETYFLYYDKSILSESDIGNLDKMLEAAQKNGRSIGWDMGNNYFNSAFYFANGVRLFGESGADLYGSTYDSAEALEVAEYIAGLQAKGMLQMNDGDATNAFTNGTIAAYVTGSWKATEIEAALGENFGVAKLPTISLPSGDKQMVSFSGIKLYVVNSHSKSPRAAMALAEFLSNEANQLKRFEMRNLLPTNLKVAENSAIQENAALAAQMEQTLYSVPMPSLPAMSNFWSSNAMAFTKEIFDGVTAIADLPAKLKSFNEGLSSSFVE